MVQFHHVHVNYDSLRNVCVFVFVHAFQLGCRLFMK